MKQGFEVKNGQVQFFLPIFSTAEIFANILADSASTFFSPIGVCNTRQLLLEISFFTSAMRLMKSFACERFNYFIKVIEKFCCVYVRENSRTLNKSWTPSPVCITDLRKKFSVAQCK